MSCDPSIEVGEASRKQRHEPQPYVLLSNAGEILRAEAIFDAEEQHTITRLNTSAGPVTVIVDSLATLTSTTPIGASR